MSKKKHTQVKNTAVILIMAALIVASFAYLSNRNKKLMEEKRVITPVQEVLMCDFEHNYPSTPKEVVKMYSEITRCFYGEEYTEDELVALANKSRELFDKELKANQTDEQYLLNLKSVIDSYKEEKRIISSFSVSSSANVEFYDYENAQWAKLYCIYSMRTGGKLEPTREVYLLRKDDVGRWKIFGWKVETTES